MPYVEQEKKIFAQGLFDVSATALERVGTIRTLDDGRKFAYAKNGAVALVAGKLCQSAAPVANHLNIAVAAAAAVDDSTITVTLGATAASVNDYQNGFLHTNDAAGEGFIYKVKSHPAANASASLVLTLYDKVRFALTTASEATLTKHPEKDVILCPTTLTSQPIGVPVVDVAIDNFFWIQGAGPCAVLTDGVVVVGETVVASNGVAGAVEDFVPGTSLSAIVGSVLRVNADTEYSLINLAIHGF